MRTSMWFARLRRTAVAGRCPLARPTDRVQGALLILATLLALVASAFAVLLGIGIQAAEGKRAEDETASRYEAAATLLADGPSLVAGRAAAVGDTQPTDATWVSRDGARHHGRVEAATGTEAGNTVPIWLDATGSPVAAPLSAPAALIDAVVIATGLAAGAMFVLALLYRAAVFLLDRVRYAGWDRDWALEQERTSRP